MLQAKIKEKPAEIKVKPMTIRQPRYSKEEFAQRGHALYESQVKWTLKAGQF
jgi:hypothetical protein